MNGMDPLSHQEFTLYHTILTDRLSRGFNVADALEGAMLAVDDLRNYAACNSTEGTIALRNPQPRHQSITGAEVVGGFGPDHIEPGT